MSLSAFTGKKLVLVSCPSEEGLTFVCFLFSVGITPAWFSFLEEKYHQLMSLGFMTWCEKGKGQRWAAPMKSVRVWASRQISKLPAMECLQLHRKETGRGARDTKPCPQTGHSHSAGHPPLLQPPPLLSTPAYSSSVLMATELKETSSQGNEEKQRTN